MTEEKKSQASLEIKLHDNRTQYKAGDVVYGRILMLNESDYQGIELVVGLSGTEHTKFHIVSADEDAIYTSNNKFHNASFGLVRYPENKTPKGSFHHDFYFKLPDWLPQSTQFISQWTEAEGKVGYQLFAQITPLHLHDYQDKHRTVALFRTTKDI